MKLETPYFLIKEEKLRENIDSFKTALSKYWPNSEIAYSVKTNSLPWLLNYLHKNGVKAEVVSDDEFKLSKLCGFRNNEIIFNGPIKGKKLLKNLLLDDADKSCILNLDSKQDVDIVARFMYKNSNNLGVRINIEIENFQKDDIGYSDDGFRFGFSDYTGDFENVLDNLDLKNKNFGLHLHCNSVSRSLSVYKSICDYAKHIIIKYNLKPSFIDVGGGFAGGISGWPSACEYIETIKNSLECVVDLKETKLLLELGSAIIGSAVQLHTSVIDIKDTKYSRIVTTNGSRIFLDPLWKKSRYKFDIQTKEPSDNIIKKQIVCGYTCMDHDRIMILDDCPELKIGDNIVYLREGSYSVTLGGAFISFLCDVYIQSNDEIKLIRNKMSPETYFAIQSVSKEIPL